MNSTGELVQIFWFETSFCDINYIVNDVPVREEEREGRGEEKEEEMNQ